MFYLLFFDAYILLVHDELIATMLILVFRYSDMKWIYLTSIDNDASDTKVDASLMNEDKTDNMNQLLINLDSLPNANDLCDIDSNIW